MKTNFLIHWTAGAALLLSSASATAQTWTLTSAPTNVDWPSLSASADGTIIGAVDYNHNNNLFAIYISTNMGVSWNSNALPTTVDWGFSTSMAQTISVSPSGKVIAASGQGTNDLYISTDSGTTWTTNDSLGAVPYLVYFTSDGSHLFAMTTAKLYVTTNLGSSWEELSYPGPNDSGPSGPFAGNSNGIQLIAVADDLDDICLSTNGGSSWFNPFPQDNNPEGFSVTSSADGTKLVVVTGYNLFSTNSGSTWEISQPSETGFVCGAGSADGSRLVEAERSSDRIYVSSDYGQTTTVTTNLKSEPTALACSQDGTRLYAGTYYGMYTALWPPNLSIQTSATNLVLSWPAPSTGWTLQQSSVLASNGWSNLTNSPNVVNYQNQVALPPPTGLAFFRLVYIPL